MAVKTTQCWFLFLRLGGMHEVLARAGKVRSRISIGQNEKKSLCKIMSKKLHLSFSFLHVSSGREDTGRRSYRFLCLPCISLKIKLSLIYGCISSFFTFIYSSGVLIILYLSCCEKTHIHRCKAKYCCYAQALEIWSSILTLIWIKILFVLVKELPFWSQ